MRRIDLLLDDLSVRAKVLLAPISGLTTLGVVVFCAWSGINDRQATLVARQEAIRELHQATDNVPAHLAQIQTELYKLSVWAAIGVTGEEIARTRADLEGEMRAVLAITGRMELGDSDLERQFRRHFETYQRQIRSAIMLSERNPVLGATAARGAEQPYDALVATAREMDKVWNRRAGGQLQELRDEGQRLAQNFLLVVAGTAGLTLLCAVLLGRRISRPILDLVRAIDGLNGGDLEIPVPQIGRRDEIGRVASAIAAFKQTLGRTHALEQQQRELIAELERLAYRDTLTGLGNRTLFQRHLHGIFGAGGATAEQSALLLLDLDRFKEVNDTLGHDAGDLLLQQVAERLKRSTRTEDRLYRLGGDEFALIFDRPAGPEVMADAAARILAALRPRFDLNGHLATVGASIGIALGVRAGEDPGDLIRHADLALYEVKERGRDGYQFFEERMNRTALRSQFIERELRSALEDNQLQLFYQPQIDLASRTLTGAEALLRWDHPVEGWISPAEFIPIAERSDLIIDLGLWVLRRAAQQARDWHAAGLRPLPLAVNVSSIQFRSAEFLGAALSCRERFKLPAGALTLELTESIFVDPDTESVVANLNRLRDGGMSLSLDDFGTGYSSLGYLRQLPFDELKIDGSFIHELLQTREARKLTSGIIALGHSLGMRVIAEGVESEDEARALLAMGCDAGQGFYFERPLPAQLFAGLLEPVPARPDAARAPDHASGQVA